MCTVSWLERPGGYELFFNRDEARERARGLPPRLWERSSVRFLAPVDGEAGGTWLAANEFGLSVGLLNLYREPGEGGEKPSREGMTSRGLLVERLAASAKPSLVRAQLGPDLLATFLPFTLFALAPGERAWVGRWDGQRLQTLEPPEPLLSSSGYDAPAAEKARRKLWRETIVDAGGSNSERLLVFHRSHRPERGARSPCMHREEAATLSFTHVRVSSDAVEMRYADGPPCETALGEPIVLARSAEALIAES